jgi:hypothetical protein
LDESGDYSRGKKSECEIARLTCRCNSVAKVLFAEIKAAG